MAFRDSLIIRGIAIPEAYLRVSLGHICNKTQVVGTIKVYESEAVARENGRPVVRRRLTFELDITQESPGVYAQAYAAAKLTHPNAVDVFEAPLEQEK